MLNEPAFWYKVTAEIDVINESWTTESESKNAADSVGLMVYEVTLALQVLSLSSMVVNTLPRFQIGNKFFGLKTI